VKQHGSEVWPLSGFHFWRLQHVYQCNIHHCTQISDKSRPFHHQFPVYAEKITAKTGYAAINIWGLIDGMLKKTCRPTYFQKAAYSGHKHCHGLKFQNVTTPDGYLAHLYGPIAGSQHDSYMLSRSDLLPQLHTLMPLGQGTIYSLFGDLAYPMSAYL
jgi:nuclease HARBI1